MTTIDTNRAPGSIHGVAGPTLDRLDELARITGIGHAGLVVLAISKFAPPVEVPADTASPGDGRGTGPVPSGPVPVHVHLEDGPCVYGDRCSQ